MKNILLFALFLSLASNIYAVEFKPYKSAKITNEQWLKYYDIVSIKHKESVNIVADQFLEIYEDKANKIMIAFTRKGHPAHPAWISRKPVKKDGFINIRTIGYFAGAEPAFAILYKQYLALNQKAKEYINQ